MATLDQAVKAVFLEQNPVTVCGRPARINKDRFLAIF
jgi:hypothetical protein